LSFIAASAMVVSFDIHFHLRASAYFL